MRVAFDDGIGWGDAKQALFARIDAELAPLREKYEMLIARPAEIEAILRDGAQRLRAKHATPLLLQLREAVGLRDLSRVSVAADVSSEKAALPLFKQYREDDGRFYFKLVDGDRVLLQSIGHESARTAGQLIGQLKQQGGAALRRVESSAVHLGDALVGHLHDGVELAEVVEALAQFAEDP